ncbi:MAG: CopD family protein [Hydrogenovibrio sp.]|uniref:CopD family protein n=1 Tax=Hydrogenovibrio TaxID=28884 RepID=UPI000378E520|nr:MULTISPECIES: CopD family protein [Hydrogenovibrio]MDR9499567.1 CopD family protein [Hydrogenovibrio sp.]
MISAFWLSLHVIAAVIWVGGMFFAYRVFRPAAAATLEPPERLRLWRQIFRRFFFFVWLSILFLFVSGYADFFWRFGGHGPHYLLTMIGIGWVMLALFATLYFVLYKRFARQVDAEEFAEAGKTLNTRIRPVIAVNLTLGMIAFVLGAAGPFIQ